MALKRGSSLSDQAAADRASDQGEVGTRMRRHPPLYAIEPAHTAAITAPAPARRCNFTSKAPVCDRCQQPVSWMGPAERKGDIGTDGVASIYVYRVICSCLEEVEGYDTPQPQIDEIEVNFPLRMGGTADWWASRNWLA